MRSELRKEMLRILEELSNPEAKPYVYEATTPRLTVDAVELLRGAKAISEKGSDPWQDYYSRLRLLSGIESATALLARKKLVSCSRSCRVQFGDSGCQPDCGTPRLTGPGLAFSCPRRH